MATRIIITHFINPHLFWYFNLDVQQFDIENMELHEIEKEIQVQYNETSLNLKFVNKSSCPEVGELIAVFFVPWQRFIRARVEDTWENGSKRRDIMVWAIDYGFPFQTTSANIYALPSHCLAHLDKIKRGGMAYIVPAEKQLIFDKLKTIRTTKWHQRACDSLEDTFLQSHRIFFNEQFSTKNGEHCWGELTIKISPSSTPEPASFYLLQQNFAIEMKSNFELLCKNFPTTEIPSWINNSGRSKYEVNKKWQDGLETTTSLSQVAYGGDNGDFCEHKVEEWRQRNNITSDHGHAPESETTSYGDVSLISPKLPEEHKTVIDDSATSDKFSTLSLSVSKSEDKNAKTDDTQKLKSFNPAYRVAQLNRLVAAENLEVAHKADVDPQPTTEAQAAVDPVMNKKPKVINKRLTKGQKVLDEMVKVVPGGFELQREDIVDTPLNKLVDITKNRPNSFKPQSKLRRKAFEVNYTYHPTPANVYDEFKDPDKPIDDNFDWLTQTKPSGGGIKSIINGVSSPAKKQTQMTAATTRCEDKSQIIQQEKQPNVPEDMTLQTNTLDDLVLAHSSEKLQLITTIDQLQLQRTIFQQLKENKIDKIYRIQAYAWTHIREQHSVFLISGPKSGKTWSYIPQVCHNVLKFVQTELGNAVSEDIDRRLRGEKATVIKTHTLYGPVAIIIVASAQHVDSVTFKCRQLLLKLHDRFGRKTPVVSCYGISNITTVKVELLNGCGILIATPASLHRLMDDTSSTPQLINYHRLRHIVIDDMDLIISRSEQVFTTVLKVLLKKTVNGRKNTTPETPRPLSQWIVTSSHWNRIMQPMLKMMFKPVLIFGDFLEAAVYGNISLRMKFCSQQSKIDAICNELVQPLLQNKRSLVFCNTKEDVDTVVAGLTAAGHKCYVIDEKRDYQSNIPKLPGVAVCMDNAYCYANIQNVHNLIHYSMPATWTRFTIRFHCIAENLSNYLDKNAKIDSNSKATARSLILFDEHSHKQLPRFFNFMRRHYKNGVISADIETAFRHEMQRREEQLIVNGVPLCKFTLEFGNCDELNCMQRHVFTCHDIIQATDEIPSSGHLKIHILKVNSPTHLSVRLLAHQAAGETIWREIRRSNEALRFGIQLNMHYSEKENMLPFRPLKLRKMCIYRSNHSHHRAIVIEIPEIMDNVPVRVYLIDQGVEVSNVEPNDLYICPPQFEQYPAQAVNVRLLNIVPYDNERTWDTYTTGMVNQWLVESLNVDDVVLVNINHVMANTIWVKNLMVMELLQTINQRLCRVNLKKNLLKHQLAIEMQNPNDGISKLIEEFLEANSAMLSIHDDTMKSNDIQMVEEEKQLPDNEKEDAVKLDEWIDLALNQLTPVELAGAQNGNWNEIFLQVYRNVKDLNELAKLIIDHVTKLKTTSASPSLWVEDITERAINQTNCIVHYKSHGYFRAKFVSVHGSKSSDKRVRFFLCDYACFVNENVSQLNNDFLYDTTDEIVNFMPYQAIHCRLSGLELTSWADVVKHKVHKECLHVYAVAKREEQSPWLQPLKINSYDILLYESDDETITETSIMVNKSLIAHGIATASAETKHYLELNLNDNMSEVSGSTEVSEENITPIDNNEDRYNPTQDM